MSGKKFKRTEMCNLRAINQIWKKEAIKKTIILDDINPPNRSLTNIVWKINSDWLHGNYWWSLSDVYGYLDK